MSKRFGIEVVLPGLNSFSESWRTETPSQDAGSDFNTVLAGLLKELSPYRSGVDVSRYLGEMKPVRYLVVDLDAEHHGHVVGVGTLLPSLKQRRGEIHDVVVAPTYRHSALGRQLLEQMIGMAKTLDLQEVVAVVKTSPERTAAHALFHRLGFRPAAVQPAEGAICYQLPIVQRQSRQLSP